MKYKRSSGILLHPTSLPGPFGIGDLGPNAFQWVDFLSKSGCKLWQILPLGPTGYGNSPYQCFSSFAGNPYLISPELLLQDGLLYHDDLTDLPQISQERIDYGQVILLKLRILDIAFENFKKNTNQKIITQNNQFFMHNAHWLEDFALFMALKDFHQGVAWTDWEANFRDREPAAMAKIKDELRPEINRHAFRQFCFFRQWAKLRSYCQAAGIRIIGDIPIFVAHDSSDVWANPGLFNLDDQGKPVVVAGVPPDYFSETGQLWGNPLYRWDKHAEDHYAWWVTRIKATLKLVDLIRLDHFRGFAGYWEIPGDAKTAVHGQWVAGPGEHFLQAIMQTLGELPFIAEDLGVITPDVIALRENFDLPGMKILQFAFAADPEDPFLPHNYPRNCVVYTGTHDNDTARGWYERVDESEKAFYRRYLHRDGSNVAWDLIRACWSSVAMFSIAPLQDFLDFDNHARMNYPGSLGGNWEWRFKWEDIDSTLIEKIKEINYLFSRSG